MCFYQLSISFAVVTSDSFSYICFYSSFSVIICNGMINLLPNGLLYLMPASQMIESGMERLHK